MFYFLYEKDVPVLRNINFPCYLGQMIALVRPTGVGKTTLTQLIPKFYDPTFGRVLIDGKDIKDVTLESLRANISPVLQDTFLFNGLYQKTLDTQILLQVKRKLLQQLKMPEYMIILWKCRSNMKLKLEKEECAFLADKSKESR